jgi:DNA mismatch repair ATPase MutL
MGGKTFLLPSLELKLIQSQNDGFSCFRLISQNVAARANGTTVIVDNLFEKLPVRRKDFVK